MSSAEGYQPWNAPDEEFQSAQQVEEHTAPNTQSLVDGHYFGELSDRDLEFSPNPAQDPDLLGDEVNDHNHTHSDEYGAALQCEGKDHIQPIGSPSDVARPQNPLSPFLWRDLTIAERELSISLDRARSSDLSVHLYNVCRLKQAARAKVPDDNGFIETKEPPKGWTAWPMPPDLVPREHEIRKWEDEEWRVGPYLKSERRPGNELRELLTARVLKTAKERLKERDSPDTSEDDQERGCSKPVITADDDVATQMLRPSVQHVMGKLDGILMGLHHARSYYSTMSTSRTTKQSSTRCASSSQRAMVTKKRNTSSVEQGGVSMHSDSETSVSDNSRNSKKQKIGNTIVKGNNVQSNLSRRGRLGLRNWSDVLNIALMAGVDSAAINRAASRCTNLIGEDMSLTILHKDLRKDKNVT